MMHSRKKKHVEPTPEDLEKARVRTKAIQSLNAAVVEAKTSGDLSAEALELTSKAIRLSPDFYTVFNYRRQILTDLIKQEAGALLNQELSFLTRLLKESPKSYTLWFQRQWTIEQCSEEVKRQELSLCDYLLSQDSRNFHVWNYRTWLVQRLESLTTQEELQFTKAMILKDFSNYSAWHYRSKVIRSLLTKELVREELQLLKSGYFTCPNDQSIWNYHRWLLAQSSSVKIASYQRTTEGLLVGFSHNVTEVASGVRVIGEDGAELSGTWEPLETKPYSYLWKFAGPADSAKVIRFDAENSQLNDSDGFKTLSLLEFELVEGGLQVQGHEDTSLLTEELASINELLSIEDEKRTLALLRKAQICEELSLSTNAETRQAYHEETSRAYSELKLMPVLQKSDAKAPLTQETSPYFKEAFEATEVKLKRGAYQVTSLKFKAQVLGL